MIYHYFEKLATFFSYKALLHIEGVPTKRNKSWKS